MYVYKSETNDEGVKTFTVGYFDPSGDFKVASRHTTREAALARVNYLNGGNGGTPPQQ